MLFRSETEFTQEYDTANGISESSAGIRVQIGTWDGPCEWLMMEDSPDLLSVGERACWLGFSNVGCDLKLYMGTWIIRISLFDFSVKAWHNRHYYKTGVQYNYWKYGILPPMPHKDFVQWKIRRSI